MASKEPKMNKQGTRGTTTLKFIRTLKITLRLETGDSQRGITASHNFRSSTVYDIRKWKN